MITVALWTTAFLSGFGGALVGFWFGFRYGEADGVAWATSKLDELRR